MAVQENPKKNGQATSGQSRKKINKTKKPIDTERLSTSLSHDLHFYFIILILKFYSDKEHPLSVTELHARLSELLPAGDRKTTNRKLEELEILPELESDVSSASDNALSETDIFLQASAGLLRLIFCGTVRKYKSPTEHGSAKYYFDPILNTAHVEMLKSSVISNNYLSEQERAMLLSVISTLGTTLPAADNAQSIYAKQTSLPEELTRIAPKHQELIPASDFRLLHNINLLYEAVTRGWKIQMLHGSFKKNTKGYQVDLVPIHPEKPYRLNPYAIFFQNGRPYLLATKEGETEPLHFRVDRIFEVNFLTDEKHPDVRQAREAIPKTLTAYYTDSSHKFFNANEYSRSHPLMAIYEKPNMMSCILDGNYSALSVLVDSFGKENVRIQSETENSAANGGRSSFRIQVRAQKEALELLCVQQHTLFTVISPDELITHVTSTLKKTLEKYEKPEA